MGIVSMDGMGSMGNIAGTEDMTEDITEETMIKREKIRKSE